MTDPSINDHPTRTTAKAVGGRTAVPIASVTATRRASWTDATTHRRTGRRRACNRTFAQWHVQSGSVAAEVSRPPAFTGAAVGASCSKHTEAKTQLLRIRIEGKQRKLVRRADVDALIEGICGVVLTHLSGLPARCAPRGDLAIRRRIEQVVYEVRTEIANVCQEMGDRRQAKVRSGS